MWWKDEVAARLKRHNQVLFSKDSEFLLDLAALIQAQDHRTLVLWALELAEDAVAQLKERYPQETQPEEALTAAWDWAGGAIKMRVAQRKILDCHALAKELDDPADIALCHAIGQACAVVHTPGHAMGYPIYDLTAIVRRLSLENAAPSVEERKRFYLDRLLYWHDQAGTYQGNWADFLMK